MTMEIHCLQYLISNEHQKNISKPWKSQWEWQFQVQKCQSFSNFFFILYIFTFFSSIDFECFCFMSFNSFDIRKPKGNECTHLRNEFLESLKLFNQCAAQYAVPVTMCRSCVEWYVATLRAFHDLSMRPDQQNIRARCIDCFMDHDTLNIVWVQYQSARNLWNEAACTSNYYWKSY